MAPISELLLARHGESTGNVAHEIAYAADAELIDIAERDPDVPLSPLGREQAADLGRRLADLDAADLDAVWCSPYVRARQTAEIALDTSGSVLRARVDERLRDRELGILDRLTSRGIRARYPEEADRRRRFGKFYYRPPGGESWADVALRLRSVLADIDASANGRVLVVCHDAVVLLVRYICEQMDEQSVLAISASTAVANASMTRLIRTPDGWRLIAFNETEHLNPEEETEHPGKADVVPS